MEHTQKVEAMPTVPCPMRKGVSVVMNLCQPCRYHGGMRRTYVNESNGKTGLEYKTERRQTGAIVDCRFPRQIQVAYVVLVDAKDPE